MRKTPAFAMRRSGVRSPSAPPTLLVDGLGERGLSWRDMTATPSPAYATLLTRREIDRFDHHDLFARELTAAFAERGTELRSVDYTKHAAAAREAISDPHCRFVMCFNGFGSDLQAREGARASAFTAANKLLFDLMHDCPAHETMAHQVPSNFPKRHFLGTDFTYAFLARLFGVRHVRFVPSIAFPAVFPESPRRHADRSIGVLLPISLPHPDTVRRRLQGSPPEIVKVFRSAVDNCLADARVHPIAATINAAADAGLALDFRRPAARFLLTTVMDYTKFEHRRRLVRAIAKLRVRSSAIGPSTRRYPA